MTPDIYPEGDYETTTLEMGSLYVDHTNKWLVQFDNYEDYDGYLVNVYTLDKLGEVKRGGGEWTMDEVREFVERDDTAYLSGHNLPGSGYYGVFAGPKPNCPVCGKFMSPGFPDYDDPWAVGYVCKEYDLTNGEHRGYMTQEQAIEEGRYLTIGEYLTRMG